MVESRGGQRFSSAGATRCPWRQERREDGRHGLPARRVLSWRSRCATSGRRMAAGVVVVAAEWPGWLISNTLCNERGSRRWEKDEEDRGWRKEETGGCRGDARLTRTAPPWSWLLACSGWWWAVGGRWWWRRCGDGGSCEKAALVAVLRVLLVVMVAAVVAMAATVAVAAVVVVVAVAVTGAGVGSGHRAAWGSGAMGSGAMGESAIVDVASLATTRHNTTRYHPTNPPTHQFANSPPS